MFIDFGHILRLILMIIIMQINGNYYYCLPIIGPKYDQINKLISDLKLSDNYYHNKPRLERRLLNVPNEEDYLFDTQVNQNKIRLRTKEKNEITNKGVPFKITPISLPSLMIFIGIIILSALVVYIEMSFNFFENIIRYLDSEPTSVIETNLKEMDYNTQRYIRKQRKKPLKSHKHRKKRRRRHYSRKQPHSKRILQEELNDNSIESEDTKITRINTRINRTIK